MTDLKILFVIDSLGTGGAERDIAERLPYLRRADISAVVVSLRPSPSGVQGELQRQRFDLRILRATGPMARVAALREIIRDEQPDLVHTTLFHSDVAGRLAAIGSRAVVLSSLVSTDYAPVRLRDPYAGHARLRVARLIDGWTARHLTAHIHANSNAVKAAALRDLRIAPRNITVIRGGRDPTRLGEPSAERRCRARLRLGIQPDEEVLSTVGRQDYPKGQRYLLQAMRSLVRTRGRLVLLLAGRPGDESSELSRLGNTDELRGRVRLLGHREDVPDILAATDLFVFPSLYEGLPGALIEAMALGLPIVASDIEPIRETVEEGRNALLVPSASPEKLARAVARLLDDHQTARAFGERSREIFEEQFTLERSVASLVGLYRRLASSSPISSK